MWFDVPWRISQWEMLFPSASPEHQATKKLSMIFSSGRGIQFRDSMNFPARRELLHSLCVLHFWINHDCNGILCCWDLSHALKQSRNARRWRIFRCERQKHPTGHSQKCLLLSVLCRTGVHLKVNLFKETRKKRERKTFQLSLEQHKKIISTATASFLLPLQASDGGEKISDDSADVSESRSKYTKISW